MPPLRVLIADDDPTCREITARLLARAGHEVVAVADGAAARAALLAAPFAAALLDLQMPELDGAAVALAVCDALPAADRPRLIALSAWDVAGAEARLLACGFDTCLSKPIRGTALIAALDPLAQP